MSDEEKVKVKVTGLAGEEIWSAEVPGRESMDSLRQSVATHLDVRLPRVKLVHGDATLAGPDMLQSLGTEVSAQLVLLDFTEEIRRIQTALAAANRDVKMTEGLSDEEFEKLEKRYDFRFPPDLKEFLQVGVPVGGSWHNWHVLALDEVIRDSVADVLRYECTPEDEEALEDLGDWAPEGERTLENAQAMAKAHPLIPIYAHRCIPTKPYECGLPVLSMHQCDDIIVYGENFWAWVAGSDCNLPDGTVPAEWMAKKVHFSTLPFWQHWI
ncbi:unnamed protein product [Effrenium voratum]|nr:unnamed protein product [Effrenium voratum]